MGRWLTLTGLHQNRLSACKTGKRMPKDHSVFGLDLPPTARRPPGLDASPAAAVGIGVPQPGPASPAGGQLGLAGAGHAGPGAGAGRLAGFAVIQDGR